jgi:hypothetical protein
MANEVQINGLRYESPGSEVIPDSEEERQRCIIVCMRIDTS